MPCYQCSHCNKCGIFSTKMELLCGTCGTPIVPGALVCPGCGETYTPKNMKRGAIGKPAGADDWTEEVNEYLKNNQTS